MSKFNERFYCSRNSGHNQFFRPHNQYLPQTVITTNPPAWNQQQIGTTTVYPYNPYPNQFYANSVNPPIYNQHQMNGGAASINVNQVPSAPYLHAGFDYGHAPQTHYANH